MRRDLTRKLVFTGLILCYCPPLRKPRERHGGRPLTRNLRRCCRRGRTVVTEHIETEMRTASGIVNGRGQFIAGVVLITAGYSAADKYSHYLIVQAPVSMAVSN